MTPFQRLGLYTAAATVAGTIAYIADVVSLWVGVAALVGGAGLALLSSFELRPEAPAEAEPEESAELTEARARVTRGRDRSAIVASAERAETIERDDGLDDVA